MVMAISPANKLKADMPDKQIRSRQRKSFAASGLQTVQRGIRWIAFANAIQ